MARRVRFWEVLLLAVLLATAGCLGQVTSSEDASDDTDPPASQATSGPAGTDTEDSSPWQDVTFELQLTAKSLRTLRILSADLNLPTGTDASVDTTTGRLTPGGSASIVHLRAERGTKIPASTLEVAFYDGLGQVNMTLEVGDFHVVADATQTIELRSNGPAAIGFVQTDGPLEVAAKTGSGIPQYGYMQWPDGDRRVLPGFDHVVQVPEGFPHIPAGETARFFVEVPDETPVFWRVNEQEPVEAREVAFRPDPGLHHVRVSIGPGDSSTELTVRTDLEDRVNGTMLAATPQMQRSIEPVNTISHTLQVERGAIWIQLRLDGDELEGIPRDLDLRLLDDEGKEVADSTTPGTTDEVLTVTHPRRTGEYTVEILAEDGAAINYTLGMHVNY